MENIRNKANNNLINEYDMRIPNSLVTINIIPSMIDNGFTDPLPPTAHELTTESTESYEDLFPDRTPIEPRPQEIRDPRDRDITSGDRLKEHGIEKTEKGVSIDIGDRGGFKITIEGPRERPSIGISRDNN